MRRVAVSFAALALIVAAAPARAQVYDSAHPVCLHVFGDLEGERMDCDFATWAQCMDAARGRTAMCEMNPYYVPRRPQRAPHGAAKHHKRLE